MGGEEYVIDIRKSISQLSELFSLFLSICSYLSLLVDFQGPCWIYRLMGFLCIQRLEQTNHYLLISVIYFHLGSWVLKVNAY